MQIQFSQLKAAVVGDGVMTAKSAAILRFLEMKGSVSKCTSGVVDVKPGWKEDIASMNGKIDVGDIVCIINDGMFLVFDIDEQNHLKCLPIKYGVDKEAMISNRIICLDMRHTPVQHDFNEVIRIGRSGFNIERVKELYVQWEEARNRLYNVEQSMMKLRERF